MLKLYKIIFVSDLDLQTYTIYCNKRNLDIALKTMLECYAGDIQFFLPLVFNIKTFKKCKNMLTTIKK